MSKADTEARGAPHPIQTVARLLTARPHSLQVMSAMNLPQTLALAGA
jgi:hypothetical protein